MQTHKSLPPDATVLATGRFSQYVVRNDWEYVHRINISGIVILVPITNDRKLVLVEQYRVPMDAPVLELPAGLVGDTEDFRGEHVLTAAERELEEETGYRAEHLEVVTAGPPTAGMCDEVLTFVKATGLTRVGPGGGDDSEDITVHEVAIEEVPAYAAGLAERGVVTDVKIFAGLYFAGK